MIYYKISSSRLPKLTLYAREHLTNGRLHSSRKLNEMLIYCLTDGVLELESGGERVIMKKGDVHIFEKGEYQRPIRATDCTYYYFHFSDFFEGVQMDEQAAQEYYFASQQSFLNTNLYFGRLPAAEFSQLMLPKHFNIGNSSYLAEIKACLKCGRLNNFTDRKEHYDMFYALNAARLFYYFHNTWSEMLLNRNSAFNDLSVRKVTEYIDNNLEKRLSGAELEQAFGYSFDHINRKFKQATGETVFAYLRKSRINQAKQLLYTKNISVGTVAEMTGFCDIYHFSKMFKKQTGITPSDYIKRLNS